MPSLLYVLSLLPYTSSECILRFLAAAIPIILAFRISSLDLPHGIRIRLANDSSEQKAATSSPNPYRARHIEE
jgi:hypothetical protein